MEPLKTPVTVGELIAALSEFPIDAMADVYGDYMGTGYLTIGNETVMEGE